MSALLSNYKNGNCSTSIFSDGTKIRRWAGEACPEFPESIDLKITNYCDAGCAYCHEKSTKRGEHASLNSIHDIIEALPSGCELAIGGGNPLAHPDLEIILRRIKKQGLIANMTVNAFHLNGYNHTINRLRNNKLIYGLGVSYNKDYHDDVVDIVDENTIVHVIAGVDRAAHVMNLPENWKFLVLGYKSFGFGENYAKVRPVEESLDAWRYWISSMMRRFHVSFDNLALRQLQIKSKLLDGVWEDLFMGDDGEFTMYADAISSEYAVSSTSAKRYPVSGTIHEMFENIRGVRKTDIKVLD